METVERGQRLTLAAEMKVPGRAWLDFEIKRESGGLVLHQTAIFHPLGLFGQLYWYSLYPMHEIIFKGMIEHLARRAEMEEAHAASAVASDQSDSRS